jgi:hypothetical protein
MSSERAGAPTHGALNREKAREALLDSTDLARTEWWREQVIDRLEACVVPDPRITRIGELVPGDFADPWAFGRAIAEILNEKPPKPVVHIRAELHNE